MNMQPFEPIPSYGFSILAHEAGEKNGAPAQSAASAPSCPYRGEELVGGFQYVGGPYAGKQPRHRGTEPISKGLGAGAEQEAIREARKAIGSMGATRSL